MFTGKSIFVYRNNVLSESIRIKRLYYSVNRISNKQLNCSVCIRNLSVNSCLLVLYDHWGSSNATYFSLISDNLHLSSIHRFLLSNIFFHIYHKDIAADTVAGATVLYASKKLHFRTCIQSSTTTWQTFSTCDEKSRTSTPSSLRLLFIQCHAMLLCNSFSFIIELIHQWFLPLRILEACLQYCQVLDSGLEIERIPILTSSTWFRKHCFVSSSFASRAARIAFLIRKTTL